MKRKTHYLFIALVALTIATLACSLVTGGDDDIELLNVTNTPAQALPPTQAPVEEPPPADAPAEAEPEAPAEELPLGEEFRSEEGGYAFIPIPDYDTEEFIGITSMAAPDAHQDYGPIIVFMGGLNEEPTTIDDLMNEFKADAEEEETDIEFFNQKEITIDGVPALSTELKGTYEGEEVSGRMVVALPTPNQQFTMAGMALTDRWQNELAPLFEAVLGTVNFFEPTEVDFFGEEDEPPTEDAPTETGKLIRQWAMSATASSEYGNPDYGATQATGAPDTMIETCQDLPTAWASLGSDTLEWLEVRFGAPVVPTEVNIIQTHSPDQVVNVEVIDMDDNYESVYTGEPRNLWDECPYTLSFPVDVDYPVIGLKITIDQSIIDTTWNEIDAVEIVGYLPAEYAEPDPRPPQPPTGDIVPDDLEPGTFSYVVTGDEETGIIESGTVQDQSTTAEYVIGLISEDSRYSATLFLPHGISVGATALKTYDQGSATKGPSATIYIGMRLYTATEGMLVIESAGDTISGTFFFSAVQKDDPDKQVTVVGAFNELPLVKK